jgi:hypothetical protein
MKMKKWIVKPAVPGRVFPIIAILLIAALSVLLPGCTGKDPYQNLTAEDAAFLRTSDELPAGAWAADALAEGQKDYDSMYQIAKTQKETDEKRIRVLSPMPVSADFQDIKEEILLSDKFSVNASEYEMKRAIALKASNAPEDHHNWKLEQKAMDESINHSARADKMVYERYRIGNLLTPFL